jgi:DNA-binding response OmpR family regulator
VLIIYRHELLVRMPDGRLEGLTAEQMRLLACLAARKGAVAFIDVLANALHANPDTQSDNMHGLIKVYVHQIRRLLGADTIETVRGYGYRMGIDSVLVDTVSGGPWMAIHA